MKILVINGPNLNLLGQREPGVYGSGTYRELTDAIERFADGIGAQIEIVQHNCEGGIIDAIHGAPGTADCIIINPGAYTHYSYAIYDALKAVDVPAVEVHLSNIAAREEFRSRSVTAAACLGQISGLGFAGYIAAMSFFVSRLSGGDGHG
ncbi:MAG: type II 3-dehydroquinate dehydratase [Oscillospiraceae bacterium]|jgi:3-dehydroquinate dehydratase-2|nr:type II 3-dehydroquinate dehydratase [Oscillospiraceae bacterium]